MFSEEIFWYNSIPGRKPSYLCHVRPQTTDVPHPGASTLISAPQPKQLVHHARFSHRPKRCQRQVKTKLILAVSSLTTI